MQVQQIMSTSVEYVPTDTTLAQAAKYMLYLSVIHPKADCRE